MDTPRVSTPGYFATRLGANELTPLDSEVVQMALLLPRWQATVLENAAHERGLSAGQMLRKLISVCLDNAAPVNA